MDFNPLQRFHHPKCPPRCKFTVFASRHNKKALSVSADRAIEVYQGCIIDYFFCTADDAVALIFARTGFQS